MSTAIAFLSGKGGSGKTTLALSMADLLCKCGIQTLLVDCDLSTNGATYFFESQLMDSEKGNKSEIYSFTELLETQDYESILVPLRIKENLDFIPSVSGISDQSFMRDGIRTDCDLTTRIHHFHKWAQRNYDVILFDCQAGYTELLSVLLPLMDVDLFVLEADSISASAMRSLHLKAGNYFGRARLYQIFNKATQEEFEIYSKIVGTFFTNIGTLLFDWRIRQAFSRAQTPDLEKTSSKYGSDLCNICKIILRDKVNQEKLERFSNELLYQKLLEERKEIIEALDSTKGKTSLLSKYINLFPGILSLVSIICVILGFFVIDKFFSENTVFFSLASSATCGVIAFIIMRQDIFNEMRINREKNLKKLKNLEKEIEKLESGL